MTVTVDAELIEAGNRAVKAGRADSLSSWVDDALVVREERERRLRGLAAQSPPTNASTGSSRTTSSSPRNAPIRRPRSWSVDAGDQAGLTARTPQGRLSSPVKLVLDSGALIALERNNRSMWRRHQGGVARGSGAGTHGGVVGQVWRGHGSRQARLAEALAGIDIRPLDESLGRAAGALLGATKQSELIDAAMVLLAHEGDRIGTSDRMTSPSWWRRPNATSRSSVSDVATSARGIRSISAARRDAGRRDEAPSTHDDCPVRDVQTATMIAQAFTRSPVLVGRRDGQSAPARRAHCFAPSRRVFVLEGRAPGTSTTARPTAATSTVSGFQPNRAIDTVDLSVHHDRAVSDRRPHRPGRYAPAVQRPKRIDARGGPARPTARDAGESVPGNNVYDTGTAGWILTAGGAAAAAVGTGLLIWGHHRSESPNVAFGATPTSLLLRARF